MVFDLDGTLLDSERVICDAVSRASTRFGRRVAPADVAPHLGAPLTELFAHFFLDGHHPVSLEEDPQYLAFHRAYVDEHDAHEDEAPRLLPDVVDTLREFSRRQIPMAIATTKPSDRARAQLEHAGVAHFFGHIQGTDAPMAYKPAPDVVLAACAGMQVAPQRVMMVGDTSRDVGAGRAASARTAVVVYQEEHVERAHGFGADVVVRSIAQLLHWPRT